METQGGVVARPHPPGWSSGAWVPGPLCATVHRSLELWARQLRVNGMVVPESVRVLQAALEDAAVRLQGSAIGTAEPPVGEVAERSLVEVTTAAAAGLLDLSDRQVRNLIAQRVLVARRVGRGLLVDRLSVDEEIERRKGRRDDDRSAA